MVNQSVVIVHFVHAFPSVHDVKVQPAIVIEVRATCTPRPAVRATRFDVLSSLNQQKAGETLKVICGGESSRMGLAMLAFLLLASHCNSGWFFTHCALDMPNPWTGKGNPYTRKEVVERLRATLKRGEPIIAAGAGTGISAKFIEKGGADLIIIYNSGRFRMAGRGSTCGLMAYGDANAIAMEIGEHEVLPVVEEIPVICGVHGSDPRRRMWHWLLQVKAMGFSGVNNFPTHSIVDGHFRQVLEETGMSFQKEVEMIALARKMDLFSIVYVAEPEEAVDMAKAGADAIIAHVGTTIGGSIGVKGAVCTMDDAVRKTQEIIDAAKRVRKDIFFLSHGGPIATPEDAAHINTHTEAVGFVGASSLERLAVEDSLTELTRRFKRIPVKQQKSRTAKR
jgi:predicted TIM-barrel enzyme